MPKKNMTPEQKQAWGAKMKAAREAKRITNNPPQVDQNNIDEILSRLREAESQLASLRGGEPNVTAKGVTGVITKASLNPKDYPDPRGRLFEESRLTLKGFNRDWFDLNWEIKRVNSETYEGFKMVQPKFYMELVKIMEDDEGRPSNKRYVVCSGSFFEDPDAFIEIASQNGIDLPETLHKPFLDEMRYLTIRDWLMEAFYPAKSTQPKSNKIETVIANRLVEVYEVNSENPEAMFAKL